MDALIPFLFFIFLGFVVGTTVEKKHYKDIRKREKELLDIAVVTSKNLANIDDFDNAQMLYGSVVISLDYFKRVLAGLRNIFGGHVVSYESLLDRGRREALLRLKEKARAGGHDMIMNLRFETASIGQVTSQKGSLGCFEVLAYATAISAKR